MNLPNTLATLFNARRGEGRPLVLLLIHSFLMGLTIIFYDTAASALFLDRFRADDLPYVYIGAAIVLPAIGFIYERIEEKISITKLFTGTLLFIILSIILFRGLLGITDSRWPVMIVFLWLEVVTVLASLEFWGLAGQIFNVRQGKRLFSLIGAGEVAAGILAGLSAGSIAFLFGTQNLLLCSALSMAVSAFVLRYIIRSFPEHLKERDDEEEEIEGEASSTRELIKEKYVKLILLISAVSVVGFYLIDFAFYDQVDIRYKGSEELAVFFGLFFAVSGIIDLIGRSFFSGRLINRYGLSFGLLALPIMLALGSGAVSIIGTVFAGTAMIFWLLIMTKLFDSVIRPNIEEPSVLILYQPLPGKRRMGVQIFAEGIIEPVGMGVAGVMLLLLTNLFAFTAIHAAYLMIFILVFWIMVAILLRKEYTAALIKALTKRTLGGVTLSLDDASSIEILKKGLTSPHVGEVLYCLNMLEEIGHDSLGKFLVGLISHDEPDIRKDVLYRIARTKFVSAFHVVAGRIEDEQNPEVKGIALTTLCALGETDAIDIVLPYLEHNESSVRKGAMVGLLRSGGIEGVLAAGESLLSLIRSQNTKDRCLAAEVLSEIGVKRFYRPLIQLLSDNDMEVKQAALTATGKLGNPRLWSLVIENLAIPEVRETAFSSLVKGGESAVKDLEKGFLSEGQRNTIRMRIIQIMGKIQSPASVAFLLNHINFKNLRIRHQILRSLSACGFRTEGKQEPLIRLQIFDEIDNVAWKLTAMVDMGSGEENAILYRALQDEIDRSIDRVILLLSFIYPSASILQAKANLSSDVPEKRAYALEAFDNLLSQDLKGVFLPLIESIQIDQKLKLLERIAPQRRMGKDVRLSEIITCPAHVASNWSKTCSLYILGKTGQEKHADIVIDALKSSNEMVRETAVWALSRIKPDTFIDHIKGFVHDSSETVSRMSRYVIQSADPNSFDS